MFNIDPNLSTVETSPWLRRALLISQNICFTFCSSSKTFQNLHYLIVTNLILTNTKRSNYSKRYTDN